jgi:hypothetical protein
MKKPIKKTSAFYLLKTFMMKKTLSDCLKRKECPYYAKIKKFIKISCEIISYCCIGWMKRHDRQIVIVINWMAGIGWIVVLFYVLINEGCV